MRGIGTWFVYILRRDADSERHYTGLTEKVEAPRIAPWSRRPAVGHRLLAVIEFPTESAGAEIIDTIRPGQAIRMAAART